MEDKLIHKELSYLIRGLLFAVHNELGRFRNEKQYADALERKLKENGLLYEREKVLSPSFNGEAFGRNKIDFLVEKKVVIELKSLPCLSRDCYFQCQRYLKSLDLDLTLLVNFRSKYLVIKRILNHEKHKLKIQTSK